MARTGSLPGTPAGTVTSRRVRRAGVALALVCGALAPSLVPSLARAQTPLPKAVGYVNDFASVLDSATARHIDSLALRLRNVTRGEMVTVTLADLGGRPVEEVALRLGREWKVGANSAVGDAARNAGVIILLVPKETATDGQGRCRIEVGQGAEGFLTDAVAGRLCRSQVELFKQRLYGDALAAIADSVAERYAAAFGVDLNGDSLPAADVAARVAADHAEEPPSAASVLKMVGLIFFAVISFIVIVFIIVWRASKKAARDGATGAAGSRRTSASRSSSSSTRSSSSSSSSSGSSSSSSSSRSSGGSSFGGGGGFSGGGGGSSW